MADTIRTKTALRTAFADNGTGAITAQNARDLIVSAVVVDPVSTADNTIQPTAINVIPLVVEATSGQTADLQQWQNSSGSPLVKVGANGQVTSAVATGTPPLVISSTTNVPNLNADYVDGHHASDFLSVSLASDPLVVPLPLGVGPNPPYAAGQMGYYARNTGWEPYVFDGTSWQTLYGDYMLQPPVSDSVTMLYNFNADDIDGNDTFNSAYSDISSISSWGNKWGTAGNATQTYDYARPTLVKPGVAGRDTILFDGYWNNFDLIGSASVLNAMMLNGLFDIIAVARFDKINCGLIGNVTGGGSSDNGWNLGVNSAGHVGFNMWTKGAVGGGVIVAPANSAGAITVGNWCVVRCRGDGTNVYISMDGSAESSTAMSTGFFQSATATRAWKIGWFYDGGVKPEQEFVGQLAALTIYNNSISTGAFNKYLSNIRRVFHYMWE